MKNTRILSKFCSILGAAILLAALIGTRSGQGISFVSRGQVIKTESN